MLIFGVFKGDKKSPKVPILQEDIDQALYGEFQHGEDSPSTDSDKTARLAAPQNSTNPSTSQLSRGSDTVRTSGKNASEDSVDVESDYVASPQASQSSTHLEEQSQKTRSGGPLWQIHYKKPPGTAVVTDGPLSTLTLENDLRLDDDMVKTWRCNL